MSPTSDLEITMRARDQASQAMAQMQKELDGVSRKAGATSGPIDRLSSSFQGISNAANKVSGVLALLSAPLIGAGMAAAKMAMDVVESQNLFEVSMGSMADAARKWSDQIEENLGVNANSVRRTIGTFNQMTTSMGIAEKGAFDMSKGLVQLGYDMSSFFNLPTEEAFQKLQAGITGETEPLKRLGIIVNETTTQQWALTKGLIKQGEEMSEAQKVVARYGAIMEQTSKIQGDMARTIESPANQMRIFQEQLQSTAQEAGKVFLPVMGQVLGWVNKEGMPRARDAVMKFSESWTAMSDEAKRNVLLVGGLLVAGGPLMKAIGAAIGGAKLLAAAFRLWPIAAAGGLAVAGAELIEFLNGMTHAAGEVIREIGLGIRALGVTIQGLPGMTSTAFGMMSAGQEWIAFGKRLKETKLGLLDVGKALLDFSTQNAKDPFDDLIKGLNDVGTDKLLEAVAALDKLTTGQATAAARLRESEKLWRGYTDAVTENAAEIPKIDWESLWKQAAAALEKVGKKAKEAGISIGDLVKALISVNPATLAAATAVAYWQNQIQAVNLAISANRDQLKAAQAEYSRLGETLRGAQAEYGAMQDRLGELNARLSEAKQRMSDLASPRLKGTGAFEDQAFQIEQTIKRLQLQKLQMPTGASTATIDAQIEAQQKQLEILRLTSDLEFSEPQRQIAQFQANLGKISVDELEAALKKIGKTRDDLSKGLASADQLKLIAEVAKATNKELTFEGAINAILKTKDEINGLSASVAVQEAAMRSQKNTIDSINASMESQQRVISAIQAAGDALNATLAEYQEQLRDAEAKQRLINDALSIAYQWFLNDRQAMVSMGGEAVDQAAIIDDKTQELLRAVSGAAQESSNTTTATLAAMVLAYKQDMATAISRVGDLITEINNIPESKTTVHTLIRKYTTEGGGDAGQDVAGSYATGTSYVPRTAPYLLHRGEAVIPAGQNRATSKEVNIYVTGNTILGDDRSTARELARILRPHLDGLVELGV